MELLVELDAENEAELADELTELGLDGPDPEDFRIREDPYETYKAQERQFDRYELYGGISVLGGLGDSALVGLAWADPQTFSQITHEPVAAAAFGTIIAATAGGAGKSFYHGAKWEGLREELNDYMRLADVDDQDEDYIASVLDDTDHVGQLFPGQHDEDDAGIGQRLYETVKGIKDRLTGTSPAIDTPIIDEGPDAADEYRELIDEADGTEYLLKLDGEDRYELWVFTDFGNDLDEVSSYAPVVFTGENDDMAALPERTGVNRARKGGSKDYQAEKVENTYGDLLG
ncbi:MAG: hypothetical protein SV186_00090 [Candidatus Nanohaloarchaea archaeon]|nr:hypothetical protein [Candidatus Nanohaloarchaea archaeon]